MINVLSGSYLLNAFGAVIYIITVTLSFFLFQDLHANSADIFISMLVVNILTIIIGFLTSYAVNHYDDSYTRWQKRALTDYLTGLLNREGFIQTFNSISDKRGVFGIFDLNDFKRLNDTYGHDFGDNALRAIATSFMQKMDDQIYLGRIGGDEFVFYLPSYTNDNQENKAISFIYERISNASLNLGTSLSVSVGVITVNNENNSFRQLYRLTDEMMYEDKKRNKAQ